MNRAVALIFPAFCGPDPNVLLKPAGFNRRGRCHFYFDTTRLLLTRPCATSSIPLNSVFGIASSTGDPLSVFEVQTTGPSRRAPPFLSPVIPTTVNKTKSGSGSAAGPPAHHELCAYSRGVAAWVWRLVATATAPSY